LAITRFSALSSTENESFDLCFGDITKAATFIIRFYNLPVGVAFLEFFDVSCPNGFPEGIFGIRVGRSSPEVSVISSKEPQPSSTAP
jgi:hypothetical protein